MRIVLQLTRNKEQVNFHIQDLVDACDNIERDNNEVLRYAKYHENRMFSETTMTLSIDSLLSFFRIYLIKLL
jgi:hypothetical protein